MSLDNQNMPPGAANINTLPPKKSGGALKWILGGCGCLSLLLVLCIGGFVYFSYSTFSGVQEEAKGFITNSSVVQEQLGSPVKIDGESFSSTAPGEWVFDFNVSGPKGSGTATVNMKTDGQSLDFDIGEASLEANGQSFNLSADDEYGINLEGMDDM